MARAGVDLTNWSGHLARVDFDHLQEWIARSETVASGSVPRDVAEFSLDDRDVSFDPLLALATANGRGTPDAGTCPSADGDGRTDLRDHTRGRPKA